MDLLRTDPVTRHVDDGMRGTYECQSCLHIAYLIVDPYGVPTHVRCGFCGYYEGDNEC